MKDDDCAKIRYKIVCDAAMTAEGVGLKERGVVTHRAAEAYDLNGTKACLPNIIQCVDIHWIGFYRAWVRT